MALDRAHAEITLASMLIGDKSKEVKEPNDLHTLKKIIFYSNYYARSSFLSNTQIFEPDSVSKFLRRLMGMSILETL